MKMKDTTKKAILAMMLGLSLASATGISMNAFADEEALNPEKQAFKNTDTNQTQSISDSVTEDENVFEKYGGCGMSCGGCASKCF